MQLFLRRPLCFFCFLFLIFSIFSRAILDAKIFIIATIFIFSIVFLLFSVLLKRERLKRFMFTSFICICFIGLAFLNTYFRMDIPEKSAEKYIGGQGVEMLVISKDSSSQYSTEYTVKIKRINEDSVDIKAKLVCGFKSKAQCFDSIFAFADIEAYKGGGIFQNRFGSSDDILLYAFIDDAENARFISSGDEPLLRKAFSNGIQGIFIAIGEIRNTISQYITKLYGDNAGGIAVGLLMNDKTGIEPEVIRDFRRSGVSHLLAVSGLHVSLLIGAIELFLRKLFVPKTVRCGLLSFAACFLIVLSGFSMSACRSVFMLFILYLNYMLMEENDSPTSLFFAVFVIVIIDPYSIYDLGLLMSFLATLGLVTIYPPLEKSIRNLFHTKLPRNIFFIGLKKLLIAIAITVVANIFLLPVMWYVFGEISVVSPIVNIAVSPIVALLLPCVVIGAALGWIPLVNELFSVAVNLLSYAMTEIIGFFSSFDVATVSLRYSFTDYIMYCFIFAMTVFMLIKLKKKWIIAIPPIAVAVIFSGCLVVYNYVSKPTLYYCKTGIDDSFIAVDKGCADIVDMSNGSISFYRNMVNIAKENTAVSIDTLIIGSVRYKHISCVEDLVSTNIVGKILLPRPFDSESAEICWDVYDIAEAHGVDVVLFDISEAIAIAKNISVAVTDSEHNEGRKQGTADLLVSYDDRIIYYGNTIHGDYENLLIEKSDCFIIGEGFASNEDWILPKLKENCIVIAPTNDKGQELSSVFNYEKIYFAETSQITIPLDFKAK